MTNEQYHSSPGYSKSHLDDIAGAPIDYWHARLNKDREPEEPSRALVLGQAIHTAILEPDLFPTEYKILPDLDLRTKNGRAERDAFVAANPGSTIITIDERDTAIACQNAVRRHPVASLLFTDGRVEQSFFTIDQETGELIKCRMDWWRESAGMVVDVKSTDDASEDGFGKSAAKFRYHLQPPWYQDVLRQEYGEAPPYWVFLAIEKKPPYKIGLYYPTAEDIQLGHAMARRDFKKILECKASGRWPDYATEVRPLKLPGWYKRKADL